ncbi:hypothetical protein OHA04_09670 [Streptomyces sp. NBC_01590]|uniref:hypothetical protein n=1 Tax=Streptomyces sp. NBC_01590 TaxID=2975887 RepID=UPI003867EF1F
MTGAVSPSRGGGELVMVRMRELYYYDYVHDFGLSGFAAALCSRVTLRTEEPVVLALAGAQAEDEDDQLGRDVRLLLDSPLPDEVLHAVWLAAVRRSFDPADEGTGIRHWLRRVAEVCPPRTRERGQAEAEILDGARPTVSEEELREVVAAEIESAAAALRRAVAVPDIVPALLRVVREVDADLGFRLFLRAAKAYSVPIGKESYDRLLGIGELLAHPLIAVHDELNVRWPAIDPGRRNFDLGRFGLPVLASMFHGTDWKYQGTVAENLRSLVGSDAVSAPGSYAAVLLEDVRRLLDSALSDEAVTAMWRTASKRLYVDAAYDNDEGFDADVRAWLERVARACLDRLREVDPVYVPYLSPARTDLTGAVLREVREAARTEAAEVRDVARVLEDVVITVDPDLGFRLLLQILFTHDVPVPDARRDRYRTLGERLGFSPDHLDDQLPRRKD